MPKQITQAELRSVLALETEVNRQMMLIRERMKKGASVEDGELDAFPEIGSHDFDPGCLSYSNMGLLIDARADVREYRETVERGISEYRRRKLTVIRGGNMEVAPA